MRSRTSGYGHNKLPELIWSSVGDGFRPQSLDTASKRFRVSKVQFMLTRRVPVVFGAPSSSNCMNGSLQVVLLLGMVGVGGGKVN